MLGQDRRPAEKLDERRENLRGDHLHRKVVHFGHREIPAADAEQVKGEPVEFRTIHDLVPGEDHIVGRQWLAIAPAHALAQFEGPRLLVQGDRPRLGQARARFLGGHIQVNQRAKEEADDGIGGGVVGKERVEGVRAGGVRNDQTPACLTGLAVGDERRGGQGMPRIRLGIAGLATARQRQDASEPCEPGKGRCNHCVRRSIPFTTRRRQTCAESRASARAIGS